MILDFKSLVQKYNLKFDNVICVGAHFGEEYDVLVETGAKHIVMIEPCEKAFSVLRERFEGKEDVTLYNCACGNKRGLAEMYTGDNTVNFGQSNSLLKPKLHLTLHSTVEFTDIETVTIAPLDDMLMEGKEPQLLVMDCQGTEGDVLRGGHDTIKTVQYVYTEINFADVYEGNTLASEMDELLSDFERVETGVLVGGCWSDALYIRKTLLNGNN